jgi:co-chaperonin GroES (HSP10)
MSGRIIDMSPAAFSYHDWPEGVRLPRIGDRVAFARYAGINIKGERRTNDRGHEERTEYRLINDKDIAAILHFPD